jgi:HPt (histidine-containing phosphotransfer) domain-containing protein
VSQESHGLKGASATFGAVRVATVCGALEHAGRDGDAEQARSLIAELEEAWEATRVALEASIAPSATAAPQ